MRARRQKILPGRVAVNKMAAQVAESQFSAQPLGHDFVLRQPLSKVTARKCALCAESIWAHSRQEVSEDALRTVVDVVQDARASEIEAGLFVGGYRAALAHARKDADAVVANAAGARLHDFLPLTRKPFDELRGQGRVLDLEWEDADDFQIPFDENGLLDAVRWMRQRRREGRAVVVSCAQGKSRSGTLAAAYLVFSRDVDDREALRRVQAARPFVSPNRGFLAQLRDRAPALRAEGRRGEEHG